MAAKHLDKKCQSLNIGSKAVVQNSVAATRIFHINQEDIPNVESVTDLGVIIDSSLKFSLHIRNIVRKASSRCYLILKCFLSKDTQSLVRAFKTYVRPLLEYNSVIWSPHLLKDINLIEKVQRRFTKRLRGLFNLSYDERLSVLNLERLEARRIRADLITAYKIIFGLTVINISAVFELNACSIRTRGHQYKLLYPVCNCDTRKYCFASRVVGPWNGLPVETINFSSLSSFKNAITSSYLNKLCAGD
jgi:ribonucleases P/MRP protein subunit RPP40